MSGKIDREGFVARLNQQFPKIAAQIDECAQGLLHLEMATLGRATQAAIDAQDKETVKQHFRFIDEVFRDAAPDVENAVVVSYVENLRFKGRKAGPTDARAILPPKLEHALRELEAHLAKIHGGDGAA